MFHCSFSLFWKPVWCWWWPPPPVWPPGAASRLWAGVGGLTNLRGRALVTGGAGELRLRPGLAGPQPRARGQHTQHQGVSGGGGMVTTQPPLRWVTPGPASSSVCHFRGESGDPSAHSSVRNIPRQLLTSGCWWRYVSLIDNLGSPHDNIDPLSDASTCSLTPASPDQRWWQVQVRPSLVSRVLVLARAPASVASLSVFVIELLPGTKAEYKRCERVQARRQEYTEYECHGVRGEFVYIRCGGVFVWLIKYVHIILFYRDDRMVETEHLGLCEVVVTPTPGRTKNKSLNFYPPNIDLRT